jgi:hypothetical protein
VKSWKTRWFELRVDGSLNYFKKQGSPQLIGTIHIHPKHTCLQIVHQFNQIAQLGLTYKTFETVVEPEREVTQGNNNELKLDISKVYAVYKRRHRRNMSINNAQDVIPLTPPSIGAHFAMNSRQQIQQQPRKLGRKGSGKMFNLRMFTKTGTELNNFKFTISTLNPEGQVIETRKLNAPTEQDRYKWISAIERLLVYISDTEKQQLSLKVNENNLFSSSAQYMDFGIVCCANPKHLLNMMDFIPKVEEDELIALMVVMDKFGDTDMASLRLCEAALVEEMRNSNDQGTLFRRNSLSTRLITNFLRVHGLTFLQPMLRQILTNIIAEDADYEIAEDKIRQNLLASKNNISEEELGIEIKKIQQHNCEALKELTRKLLEDIMSFSLIHCPLEIRLLMKSMYELSDKEWKCGAMCVGALFFLRFVCPVIISPHLFNISNMPKRNAQRTLVLLTKIIQNISNGISTSNKEAFMNLLHDFVQEMKEPVAEFETELAKVEKQSHEELKVSQYIDDNLLLLCLQILHRLFQKVSTNNCLNIPNPNIQDYYRSILSSLRFEPVAPRRSRRIGITFSPPAFHSSKGNLRNSNHPGDKNANTDINNGSSSNAESKNAKEKRNESSNSGSSSVRKRSFEWDLSDKEIACGQIISCINSSIGSVLLDINSQLLNQSLAQIHLESLSETPCNIHFSSTAIEPAMMKLASAIYAFLRLNLGERAWATIEDLIRKHSLLTDLFNSVSQRTEFVEVMQFEDLKLHFILWAALNNGCLLSSLEIMLSPLEDNDIDEKMKKRKKKIIDLLAIPNWSCYHSNS